MDKDLLQQMLQHLLPSLVHTMQAAVQSTVDSTIQNTLQAAVERYVESAVTHSVQPAVQRTVEHAVKQYIGSHLERQLERIMPPVVRQALQDAQATVGAGGSTHDAGNNGSGIARYRCHQSQDPRTQQTHQSQRAQQVQQIQRSQQTEPPQQTLETQHIRQTQQAAHVAHTLAQCTQLMPIQQQQRVQGVGQSGSQINSSSLELELDQVNSDVDHVSSGDDQASDDNKECWGVCKEYTASITGPEKAVQGSACSQGHADDFECPDNLDHHTTNRREQASAPLWQAQPHAQPQHPSRCAGRAAAACARHPVDVLGHDADGMAGASSFAGFDGAEAIAATTSNAAAPAAAPVTGVNYAGGGGSAGAVALSDGGAAAVAICGGGAAAVAACNASAAAVATRGGPAAATATAEAEGDGDGEVDIAAGKVGKAKQHGRTKGAQKPHNSGKEADQWGDAAQYTQVVFWAQRQAGKVKKIFSSHLASPNQKRLQAFLNAESSRRQQSVRQRMMHTLLYGKNADPEVNQDCSDSGTSDGDDEDKQEKLMFGIIQGPPTAAAADGGDCHEDDEDDTVPFGLTAQELAEGLDVSTDASDDDGCGHPSHQPQTKGKGKDSSKDTEWVLANESSDDQELVMLDDEGLDRSANGSEPSAEAHGDEAVGKRKRRMDMRVLEAMAQARKAWHRRQWEREEEQRRRREAEERTKKSWRKIVGVAALPMVQGDAMAGHLMRVAAAAKDETGGDAIDLWSQAMDYISGEVDALKKKWQESKAASKLKSRVDKIWKQGHEPFNDGERMCTYQDVWCSDLEHPQIRLANLCEKLASTHYLTLHTLERHKQKYFKSLEPTINEIQELAFKISTCSLPECPTPPLWPSKPHSTRKAQGTTATLLHGASGRGEPSVQGGHPGQVDQQEETEWTDSASDEGTGSGAVVHSGDQQQRSNARLSSSADEHQKAAEVVIRGDGEQEERGGQEEEDERDKDREDEDDEEYDDDDDGFIDDGEQEEDDPGLAALGSALRDMFPGRAPVGPAGVRGAAAQQAILRPAMAAPVRMSGAASAATAAVPAATPTAAAATNAAITATFNAATTNAAMVTATAGTAAAGAAGPDGGNGDNPVPANTQPGGNHFPADAHAEGSEAPADTQPVGQNMFPLQQEGNASALHLQPTGSEAAMPVEQAAGSQTATAPARPASREAAATKAKPAGDIGVKSVSLTAGGQAAIPSQPSRNQIVLDIQPSPAPPRHQNPAQATPPEEVIDLSSDEDPSVLNICSSDSDSDLNRPSEAGKVSLAPSGSVSLCKLSDNDPDASESTELTPIDLDTEDSDTLPEDVLVSPMKCAVPLEQVPNSPLGLCSRQDKSAPGHTSGASGSIAGYLAAPAPGPTRSAPGHTASAPGLAAAADPCDHESLLPGASMTSGCKGGASQAVVTMAGGSASTFGPNARTAKQAGLGQRVKGCNRLQGAQMGEIGAEAERTPRNVLVLLRRSCEMGAVEIQAGDLVELRHTSLNSHATWQLTHKPQRDAFQADRAERYKDVFRQCWKDGYRAVAVSEDYITHQRVNQAGRALGTGKTKLERSTFRPLPPPDLLHLSLHGLHPGSLVSFQPQKKITDITGSQNRWLAHIVTRRLWWHNSIRSEEVQAASQQLSGMEELGLGSRIFRAKLDVLQQRRTGAAGWDAAATLDVGVTCLQSTAQPVHRSKRKPQVVGQPHKRMQVKSVQHTPVTQGVAPLIDTPILQLHCLEDASGSVDQICNVEYGTLGPDALRPLLYHNPKSFTWEVWVRDVGYTDRNSPVWQSHATHQERHWFVALRQLKCTNEAAARAKLACLMARCPSYEWKRCLMLFKPPKKKHVLPGDETHTRVQRKQTVVVEGTNDLTITARQADKEPMKHTKRRRKAWEIDYEDDADVILLTAAEKKKNARRDTLDRTNKDVMEQQAQRREILAKRQAWYSMGTIPKMSIVTGSRQPLFPGLAEEVMVAAGLATKLKAHQWDGVRFLWSSLVKPHEAFEEDMEQVGGCILAHSMGLGKTLQTITFLHSYFSVHKKGRVLVVVPKNVVYNWMGEFRLWLANLSEEDKQSSTLTYEKVHFYKRSKKTLQEWYSQDGSVLIVSYTMFQLCVTKKVTKPHKAAAAACQGAEACLPANVPAGEVKANASCKPGAADEKTECEMSEREILLLGPDLVVADEAHNIRNTKTLVSKALGQLCTKRRLALTGYPLQNRVEEYYTMAKWVNEDCMPGEKLFRDQFSNPIKAGMKPDARHDDQDVMQKQLWVLEWLLDGIVHRKGPQLLKNEIPDKLEHLLMWRLSPEQELLYKAFLKHTHQLVNFACHEAKLKVMNQPQVLEAWLLKKIKDIQQGKTARRNGPADNPAAELGLESEPEPEELEGPTAAAVGGVAASGLQGAKLVQLKKHKQEPQQELEMYTKLLDVVQGMGPERQRALCQNLAKDEFVMDLLEECRRLKEKVVLFSGGMAVLTRIGELMENKFGYKKNVHYLRVDGRTSEKDRDVAIRQFNENSQTFVFLAGLKTASVGINLVSARRVILYDVPWNPVHLNQAIARIYRMGQRCESFVYRLAYGGTSEAAIYLSILRKEMLFHNLVEKKNVVCQDLDNVPGMHEYVAPKERCLEALAKEVLDASCQQNDKALHKVLGLQEGAPVMPDTPLRLLDQYKLYQELLQEAVDLDEDTKYWHAKQWIDNHRSRPDATGLGRAEKRALRARLKKEKLGDDAFAPSNKRARHDTHSGHTAPSVAPQSEAMNADTPIPAGPATPTVSPDPAHSPVPKAAAQLLPQPHNELHQQQQPCHPEHHLHQQQQEHTQKVDASHASAQQMDEQQADVQPADAQQVEAQQVCVQQAYTQRLDAQQVDAQHFQQGAAPSQLPTSSRPARQAGPASRADPLLQAEHFNPTPPMQSTQQPHGCSGPLLPPRSTRQHQPLQPQQQQQAQMQKQQKQQQQQQNQQPTSNSQSHVTKNALSVAAASTPMSSSPAFSSAQLDANLEIATSEPPGKVIAEASSSSQPPRLTNPAAAATAAMTATATTTAIAATPAAMPGLATAATPASAVIAAISPSGTAAICRSSSPAQTNQQPTITTAKLAPEATRQGKDGPSSHAITPPITSPLTNISSPIPHACSPAPLNSQAHPSMHHNVNHASKEAAAQALDGSKPGPSTSPHAPLVMTLKTFQRLMIDEYSEFFEKLRTAGNNTASPASPSAIAQNKVNKESAAACSGEGLPTSSQLTILTDLAGAAPLTSVAAAASVGEGGGLAATGAPSAKQCPATGGKPAGLPASPHLPMPPLLAGAAASVGQPAAAALGAVSGAAAAAAKQPAAGVGPIAVPVTPSDSHATTPSSQAARPPPPPPPPSSVDVIDLVDDDGSN